MSSLRTDGRQANEAREISFQTHYIKHHPGSVLVSFGDTKVLCACTVEKRVPPFRLDSGGGWLTASYDMLPAATHDRRRRSNKGPDGRATEIQRLIGRALRNVVNFDVMGQKTFHVDCDVIQADGGTRTAAITGGWVALALAARDQIAKGKMKCTFEQLVHTQVAALSLGIHSGSVYSDLCYKEDVAVDTDFNLVGRSDGALIELQGTAEGEAMTREQINVLLDQGQSNLNSIFDLQRQAIA